MRALTVTDDAWQDLRQGRLFYRGRENWLGDYFMETFFSEAASLLLFCGRHRRALGCHVVKMGRFPYSIFYRLLPDELVVVAILPQRRDPKWIRSQLRSR